MKATYQIVPPRKVIAIFFLIAIVLFSAFHPGSLPAAQAQQGGTESLSGWFTIIRGDGQDGTTKEIHMLATDDGQSVVLLLDENVTEPAGGLLALDRQHITVNGDWSGAFRDQGGTQTFQVTSIAPLQKVDVASAAVTGPQKWISIMCKFQDAAAEPKNISYFQNMYMNTYPGLDHFWRQLSYNLINTVGSTASGWYTLPHPRSYYLSGGEFNLDQAAIDCTGVANPSVNFSTYAGINLMFNNVLEGQNCCAWGGGAYLTLDGVTKVWKMTWEPPWGYSNVAVLEHEMGHAYGLPHSSGNYGQTYDNEWDVMSDTWTGCYNRGGQNPVYGCLGQHTIAYHKDKLGWIPAAQKTTVPAGTAKTVLLERLALPQTNNLKMIKIPIGGSSTRFYTVEARRLTGYDVQLAGNAVIIHEVNTTRHESPAHVIDIDNNGVTGDPGAMWTTGEIFRDSTYKIAVAVLARTASGFRVHVNSGLNIYYITGNIGVSNVTIKYTGGSTTTDGTGRYIFPVFAGWSGTVTPSKAGYTFTPTSRTYSNVTADKIAQNFTSKSSFSISGTTGVAETMLSYTTTTPKTVISQTNGSYSLRVPGGWDGLVVPSHACYSFSPANRVYTNLVSNQTSQNYAPSFNSDSGCADTYVRIGGGTRGRFGLLPGAGTRASFKNLDRGPVRIFSNNSAPLIVSERVNYKVNNITTSFTEMMGLPNSQMGTTYWLPWYNNVALNTQLRIANVSGSTATVQVTIGGVPAEGSPFTLAPGASMRKSFAGIDKGPVKIQSNVRIVAAERVIYKVNGVNTSFSEMMALPASQLDTTYWLPWYNNKDLDTQLRFSNVSGTTATVHVTIGGAPAEGSPFTLAPGASLRRSFPGIDKGPVKIESDVNIVAAERVVYKVNNIPTSFSEMMALPNKHLDTTYWLPWYNSKHLDTQLRIANVSATPASVTVTIGGVPVDGSPFTLPVGATLRKNFPGIDKGPVKIESDVDIVAAQRMIYKINRVGVSFSEMMALPNGLLDAIYWLPWYNNVDLDTQLRFATP